MVIKQSLEDGVGRHTTAMPNIVLHSYFRSSCSWRVRIVLNLKNVPFEYQTVHLLNDGGEQLKESYLKINPMGQVPALVVDGITITQSVAIMEFLEERYPEIPLLPSDILSKAKVREIVEVINAGTQPLQNLSVLKYYTSVPEARVKWANHFISKGLKAVEKLLALSAGKYSVGDEVTLADCCLVPQVYNAKRFNVDTSVFPTINTVLKNLESIEAFKKAEPSMQPDCPPELK